MTNADTINADLARMEGECADNTSLSYNERAGFVRCNKCNAAWVSHYSYKIHPVPNRLSDGAYILGLVDRYKISIGWHYEWAVASCQGSDYRACDEITRHAIALAAIQRWKEGGG